jgi:vacuolar-type H+-ATPase subunit I/STV1
MSTIKPPTLLERLAGGLSTNATLTAISAAVGTPLTALLPVLSQTLAAQRQQQRIETALQEIDAILRQHEDTIKSLSDEQYKFINEAIVALLSTTDVQKMSLLRNAVHNGIKSTDLPSHEAAFLGRVVRDISAEEAFFLIENFSYERIWLSDLAPAQNEKPTLAVKPSTNEGQVVLGLISLGLIITAEPTWDDSGLLRYTPFAAKIIALLSTQ